MTLVDELARVLVDAAAEAIVAQEDDERPGAHRALVLEVPGEAGDTPITEV